MKIDNRRDILLLLLYSPGAGEAVNEPIVGRTRLTKAIFLFRQEALKHFRKGTAISEENFYEFFPWNFGPFSKEVYDDLNFFLLRGFIESLDSDEEALPESAAEWEEWLSSSQPDYSDREYTEYEEQQFRLTPNGCKFAAKLYALLSGEQRTLLKQFKTKISKVPMRVLLRYVYERYPDQIVNSQIKEKVLGDL